MKFTIALIVAASFSVASAIRVRSQKQNPAELEAHMHHWLAEQYDSQD